MAIRLGSAFLLATAITMGLFFLMQSLISQDPRAVGVLAVEEVADDRALGLIELDQRAELVLQLANLHGVASCRCTRFCCFSWKICSPASFDK